MATKQSQQAGFNRLNKPAVAKIDALDKSVVYVVGLDQGYFFQPLLKADGSPARFETEQEAWDFLAADLKDFDKKYKAAAGAAV
jgi:hypothetical protein